MAAAEAKMKEALVRVEAAAKAAQPSAGSETRKAKKARALPEGWYENKDPGSGKTYYYTIKGQTQWKRPTKPPARWQPDTR